MPVVNDVRGGLFGVGAVSAAPAPAAPKSKFQPVLDSVREALKAAQRVTGVKPDGTRGPDQFPVGTDSAVRATWIGAVTRVTTSSQSGFPFLQATIVKAEADPSGYGQRWLATAEAMASELKQILSDQQNVGYWNGLIYAIEETKKAITPTLKTAFYLAAAVFGGVLALRLFGRRS